MNNVCLCIGKYAKNPYYVKLSDTSLYSMEELCYYFLDKVHLLDDSLVSQELAAWVRDECGLGELADELELCARKHVSLAVFVNTILERTGIYDSETVKGIDKVLKEQASLTTAERYKKRAEYLYSQGRFKQALAVYSELMDYLPASDISERALLYYDMASVYAMDFAYEDAARLYEYSYELSASKQTRLAYIIAKKLSLTDYAFGSFKREHPEWEQDFERAEEFIAAAQDKWDGSREKQAVGDLLGLKATGKRAEYDEQLALFIERLKKDYRKQTRE